MAKTVNYDASHLKCPLPVLKARKVMEGLAAGDTLILTTTDDASRHDVVAWAETVGHTVLKATFNDEQNTFEIQKS